MYDGFAMSLLTNHHALNVLKNSPKDDEHNGPKVPLMADSVHEVIRNGILEQGHFRRLKPARTLTEDRVYFSWQVESLDKPRLVQAGMILTDREAARGHYWTPDEKKRMLRMFGRALRNAQDSESYTRGRRLVVGS